MSWPYFGNSWGKNRVYLHFPEKKWIADVAFNMCSTIRIFTGNSCKSGSRDIFLYGHAHISHNTEAVSFFFFFSPPVHCMFLTYWSLHCKIVTSIMITWLTGSMCWSVLLTRSCKKFMSLTQMCFDFSSRCNQLNQGQFFIRMGL